MATELYNMDSRAEELVLAMVDDGIFEIDKRGRIWRTGVRRGRGPVVPTPRRRAEYPREDGYLRLRVSVCGVRLRVSAHRIVFRHFHGDIPEGMVVDHAGSKDDNRPEQLEAVTQSENIRRIHERAKAAA